jgi:hypothetical protein
MEMGHRIDGLFKKSVVHAPVHVNPFDRAAGLPGIVEGPFHHMGHGKHQVGILGHIGRILAPQFQAHIDETAGRRLVHATAASHGPGKHHMIDPGIPDQIEGLVVREDEMGDKSRHLVEGRLKVFPAQRCFGTVLQQHTVARHQGRHHHVDGNQQGIVPGRDIEHHPQGFPLDTPVQVILGRQDLRCQGIFRNGQHVPGPLEQAGDLVMGRGDGFAHLARDGFGNHRFMGAEIVQSVSNRLDTLCQGNLAPVLGCGFRRLNLCLHLRRGIKRQRAIDTLIVGIDDAQGHMEVSSIACFGDGILEKVIDSLFFQVI